MTVQFSATVRNGMGDAIETAIGTAPLLRMYTGAMPANCATAASGTKVVEMTLPSDWLANASSGAKAKSGTWEQTSATAAGTAGYYRVYDSTGTVCHIQGTVTATGGGGDLTLDNAVIAAGQDVVVTSYTLTLGNA